MPTVERHARRIFGNSIYIPGRQHHRLGADGVPFARAKIKCQHAIGAIVFDQQLYTHGPHQDRAAITADLLTDDLFEISTIKIDAIAARQTKGAKAIIIAPVRVFKINTERLDLT
jgi:hypothetical protein